MYKDDAELRLCSKTGSEVLDSFEDCYQVAIGLTYFYNVKLIEGREGYRMVLNEFE